jgi:hypothetical protein
MRLAELQPIWITPNLLLFLCPHCKNIWLSCKNIPRPITEQMDIFEKHFGLRWNWLVVPCDQTQAWAFSEEREFDLLTVSPSIDASKSGHWHGHIQKGGIQ